MSNQTTILGPAEILTAARRLEQAGYLHQTPVELCEPLSERVGAQVYQKLELYQRTGSFKLRGATNKLMKLREEGGSAFERGIVTASAGNHALGLSYAARELGAKATIVVPQEVSPAKLTALRRFPVEIIIAEGNYDQAEATARRLEQERGLTFVSAYNDREVAGGQGTLAVEALAALPQADLLLVPVGGGGLIGGVATWAKVVNPRLRVVGVQSEASAAMYESLRAGQLVEAPELPTLADGLAGNVEAGSLTFDLVQNYVDEIVLITEESLAEAIRYYWQELHLIVEGSGAVGMAALLSGRVDLSRLGVVQPKILDFVTGRNIAASRLQSLLAPV